MENVFKWVLWLRAIFAIVVVLATSACSHARADKRVGDATTLPEWVAKGSGPSSDLSVIFGVGAARGITGKARAASTANARAEGVIRDLVGNIIEATSEAVASSATTRGLEAFQVARLVEQAWTQAVVRDHWRSSEGVSYSLVSINVADVSAVLQSTNTDRAGADRAVLDRIHYSLKGTLAKASDRPDQFLGRRVHFHRETPACQITEDDVVGKIPGSVLGIPAGLIGFVGSLVVCIPLDIINLPGLFNDKRRSDVVEGLLWCHLWIPGIAWEYGYQVGAWPFLKAKEKIVFEDCDTGVDIAGRVAWDGLGAKK